MGSDIITHTPGKPVEAHFIALKIIVTESSLPLSASAHVDPGQTYKRVRQPAASMLVEDHDIYFH